MENSVTNLTTKLVQYYEEFESNTQDSRAKSEKNRDYYDNKQWTREEVNELNARSQPVITFNMIARTINALLGLEREKRVDPKVLPRTPKHEEDAEGATDALRYVVDNNDFDEISNEGFGNLLIEGTEGVDIQMVDKGGELEVEITPVMWDRMFWDVHSRRKNFSDAKYKGIVIWMDWDDAEGRKDFDQEVMKSATSHRENNNTYNETHDDKPSFKWNDHQRKRVKICYIHYKEKGVWNYAYFTNGGILKGGKPIPYMDEYDRPQSSLEFQSAFVDREGNRYGYADALISPQDEVNKRRSKALHHINQRQTFSNQKAQVNREEAKRELSKPDGHIEMQAGEWNKDFGLIQTQDMAAGNLQLLLEAKEAFNVVGANTSVTGKEDRVMSGRAEIVRQNAGVRELSPIMDAHTSFRKRVYRQAWNRIRQYWDGERWVRVTDDEDNLKFVAVNQPVTMGDVLMEEHGELPPEYMNDPRLQEVVSVKNQLSKLDVDIMIEESPDVANIQQEQFELVAQMYQANPDAVPFESLIELSSLRNKDVFLEKIKGNQEAQAQAAQEAQEAQEIIRMEQMAGIEKTQSETEKNEALAVKAFTESAMSMAQ